MHVFTLLEFLSQLLCDFDELSSVSNFNLRVQNSQCMEWAAGVAFYKTQPEVIMQSKVSCGHTFQRYNWGCLSLAAGDPVGNFPPERLIWWWYHNFRSTRNDYRDISQESYIGKILHENFDTTSNCRFWHVSKMCDKSPICDMAEEQSTKYDDLRFLYIYIVWSQKNLPRTSEIS